MMRCLVLLVLFTGACLSGEGGSPPPVDAAGGSDGGGPLDGGAAPDGPTSVCTGQPYDSCNDNTDCTSGLCREFNSAGIKVCTQPCDSGTPCPQQPGGSVSCNNMGVCRPQAANSCTAP